MRVSHRLHQGIVLDAYPVPHDLLMEDLVKPRDVKWFKDEFDGGVDFRMRVNDRIYWVRWTAEWNIEVRKYLKKLLLRWYYDDQRILPTKRADRLPFPVDHFKPIDVYATH